MLHVLVGENSVKDGFEETALAGGYVRWIVPKAAEPGDPVLFVFNRDQILAMGSVASDPKSVMFGHKSAFQSRVGELRLLKRPIPLTEILRKIPDWKWPTYPRSLTTPSVEVAKQLHGLVQEHVARSGLIPPDGPKPARGRARKKPARNVASTPALALEPKDIMLTGAQLDALIREQTGGARLGAEGRRYLRTHMVTERKSSNRKYILEFRAQRGPLSCDACGVELAQRYGPEHREVLELHHRIPLSRGTQRPKGTDAFALLCPTCHRVIHYRREEPLDVDVLQAQLRQ
jgi:hypothetical protein